MHDFRSTGEDGNKQSNHPGASDFSSRQSTLSRPVWLSQASARDSTAGGAAAMEDAIISSRFNFQSSVKCRWPPFPLPVHSDTTPPTANTATITYPHPASAFHAQVAGSHWSPHQMRQHSTHGSNASLAALGQSADAPDTFATDMPLARQASGCSSAPSRSADAAEVTDENGPSHSAAQPQREGLSIHGHERCAQLASLKRPRPLHLHGDESDDVTLLELRGAISSQKRLRCERVASVEVLTEMRDSSAQVLQPEADGLETEEGLQTLEDSLIGNDVLLEECKRQSNHLRAAFIKCMGTDRDGNGSVRLEHPGQLQCTFKGLTLPAVVRMLGEHCAALKPYQVAAVGFMACLVQRSVRGCILASDSGLGARTTMSVWCGLMQRSNSKPMPTVRRDRTARHVVAVAVCPAHSLPRWRTVLRRWAPALDVAALDGTDAGAAVSAGLHSFAAQLDAGITTAAPPCDVLLVPADAVFDDDTVAVLERLPWLLAIMEGCGGVDRACFCAWRRVLAGAHQRIALEPGSLRAVDCPRLRNLLEVVQPQLMDCRQGNMLTLAPCASPAAEKHEGKRMRETLAPYILHLSATAVVHQWAQKQYVQRSSHMPELHARIYREHAAQHAQQLLDAGPLQSCSSAAVPKSDTTDGKPQQGHDKLLDAFTSLYQIAQHPLLGHSHYSAARHEIQAACSGAPEGSMSGVLRATQDLDSIDSLPDITIHKICSKVPNLNHLQLQTSAIEDASKCGSLIHMLHGAGPAVITSSFPDILDIVAALLAPRGVRFLQVDMDSSVAEAEHAAAEFSASRVSVVLLQQQAALKLPHLDLSRADLCVFYDSGISRAAERAVEACCLKMSKPAMTTFCRLVTQGSMDESVAELQRRRRSMDAAPCASSHASCCGGGVGSDPSCADMLTAAVRAEVLRHCPIAAGAADAAEVFESA
eukprot:jgi/Ulvmu1/622/UM001_0630.1